MKRGRVLIICSDETARSVRAFALSTRRANVFGASSAEEAANLYGESCADVVIHDCGLERSDLTYFAPCAIYWPRGAREGGNKLKAIMPRLLEALDLKRWKPRRRMVRSKLEQQAG